MTDRTWADGVKDAERIVQSMIRNLQALDHPSARVHPAVFNALDEVVVHLTAMLNRGEYASRDAVLQMAGDSALREGAALLKQRFPVGARAEIVDGVFKGKIGIIRGVAYVKGVWRVSVDTGKAKYDASVPVQSVRLLAETGELE